MLLQKATGRTEEVGVTPAREIFQSRLPAVAAYHADNLV